MIKKPFEFKNKSHFQMKVPSQITCSEVDTEQERWTVNFLFLWVSYMLCVMYIPCSVLV